MGHADASQSACASPAPAVTEGFGPDPEERCTCSPVSTPIRTPSRWPSSTTTDDCWPVATSPTPSKASSNWWPCCETHRVERVGIEGSGNFGRAVAVHLALGGRDDPGADDRRGPNADDLSRATRSARQGQDRPRRRAGDREDHGPRTRPSPGAADRRTRRGPACPAGLSRGPGRRADRPDQPGPRRPHRARPGLPAPGPQPHHPQTDPGRPRADRRRRQRPRRAVSATTASGPSPSTPRPPSSSAPSPHWSPPTAPP